MRISQSCEECLYRAQTARTSDAQYLSKVKKMLDERREDDTAPYMVWQFNQEYQRMFGSVKSWQKEKRKFNDLVLSMVPSLRAQIESSPDPLKTAILYSRIGNYIDYGAMNQVDTDTFLDLFSSLQMSREDEMTYTSFRSQCERAETFLLIADNCGEIVLDRLFLEQLKNRFQQLQLYVMVRGGEVLNDALREDAEYVGISRLAEIVDTGCSAAGVILKMLDPLTDQILRGADVILAKGQGNYETLSGCGIHMFYSLLCKCELFINKFNVPHLTGIFTEES